MDGLTHDYTSWMNSLLTALLLQPCFFHKVSSLAVKWRASDVSHFRASTLWNQSGQVNKVKIIPRLHCASEITGLPPRPLIPCFSHIYGQDLCHSSSLFNAATVFYLLGHSLVD